MAARQFLVPGNHATVRGLVAPGATAELFTTGTTTPQPFYSDTALTVSLGTSLTANGVGNFPIAYQNEATAFRLILKDRDGAELDGGDIDPFYFGQTITSIASEATFATRTALAAVTGTAGTSAILAEAGREGTFVYSTSDLSANVTADAAQGVYVAPAAATTGASGAWVRKFTGPLDIRWFGGVGDSTALVGSAYNGTDNSAALASAQALALLLFRCGAVHFPRASGAYRFASKQVFTAGIKITGDGWHQNPGTVGVTTYTGIQQFSGSVLCFDTDVGGFQFIAYTDNAANATAFEYQSAVFSSIENILLYGGAGTGTTNHGIEARTVLFARNVYIENFAGSGLRNEAWDSGADPYGSTDGSTFISVKSRSNKIHGIHNRGGDANVMNFVSCDTSVNGGCGVFDESGLGNTYTGCHSATNNQSYGTPAGYTAGQRTAVTTDAPLLSSSDTGSYYTTGSVAAHLFSGCFAETGNGTKAHLIAPTTVIGGILAAASQRTATSTCYLYGLATLENVDSATPAGPSFTFNKDLTVAQSAGTVTLNMTPGSATYSNIQMKGTSANIAIGLDILAGSNNAYFSADNFTFRTAASANMATITTSALNLATGVALKNNAVSIINGSGVLQAAGFPALTGDISTSAGSLTTAIGANKVTLGMMATLATVSLIGNATGGAATPTAITLAGGLSFSGTTITPTGGALAPASVAATGAITSSGGGVGYATGAGGTQTQATSKATGVTLDKLCGDITLNGAALAASTTVSFVFTNNKIAAGDMLVLTHSATGTFGSYTLNAHGFGAGSCTIDVRNVSLGSLSEAIIIRYAVIKAVQA